MNVKNFMELRIPSKSQNEAFARVATAAFASQLDPTINWPILRQRCQSGYKLNNSRV